MTMICSGNAFMTMMVMFLSQGTHGAQGPGAKPKFRKGTLVLARSPDQNAWILATFRGRDRESKLFLVDPVDREHKEFEVAWESVRAVNRNHRMQIRVKSDHNDGKFYWCTAKYLAKEDTQFDNVIKFSRYYYSYESRKYQTKQAKKPQRCFRNWDIQLNEQVEYIRKVDVDHVKWMPAIFLGEDEKKGPYKMYKIKLPTNEIHLVYDYEIRMKYRSTAPANDSTRNSSESSYSSNDDEIHWYAQKGDAVNIFYNGHWLRGSIRDLDEDTDDVKVGCLLLSGRVKTLKVHNPSILRPRICKDWNPQVGDEVWVFHQNGPKVQGKVSKVYSEENCVTVKWPGSDGKPLEECWPKNYYRFEVKEPRASVRRSEHNL